MSTTTTETGTTRLAIVNPAAFLAIVRQVAAYRDTESVRYMLSAIEVEIRGDGTWRFVATDARRLIVRECKLAACNAGPEPIPDDFRFYLPNDVVKALLGAGTTSRNLRILIDDSGRVTITWQQRGKRGQSERTVSGRADGRFPDWQPIVDGVDRETPSTIASGTVKAWRFSVPVPDSKYRVTWNPDDGLIARQDYRVEIGRNQFSEHQIAISGQALEIGLDLEYLAETIDSLPETCELQAEFYGPSEPVRFHCPGQGTTVLIMPWCLDD